MELVGEHDSTESPDYPEEFREVLETLADIYGGVQEAIEMDSLGRFRKMAREYADPEDFDSDEIGNALRLLEGHDIGIQDGNRWRITEANTN